MKRIHAYILNQLRKPTVALAVIAAPLIVWAGCPDCVYHPSHLLDCDRNCGGAIKVDIDPPYYSCNSLAFNAHACSIWIPMVITWVTETWYISTNPEAGCGGDCAWVARNPISFWVAECHQDYSSPCGSY